MRARKLNKRIEVYQSRAVADGYGGNTVTDNLISTSWASIRTLGSEKVSELGLDYTKDTLLVTTRIRNDFSYNSKSIYIKYRGNKYVVSTFPINENFTDAFVSFTAVKEKPTSETIYETIV